MMPMKARARGMPTAQPTMRGMLDPPSSLLSLLGSDSPDAAVSVGGIVEVRTAVERPSLPEMTEVWTVVRGVVRMEEEGESESEFESVDGDSVVWGESEDESSSLLVEVGRGLLPPPLPERAEPVMVARLGASLAWFRPIVA